MAHLPLKISYHTLFLFAFGCKTLFHSRNRSNYPVYCEPPVVTNSKLSQINRNSRHSVCIDDNFGGKYEINYGKFEATTDDDDDGEVSYYMMNEMVSI